MQNLATQIEGLDQLFALAQTTMDAVSAKQRQAWIVEYQHLSQQLNGATCSAPSP